MKNAFNTFPKRHVTSLISKRKPFTFKCLIKYVALDSYFIYLKAFDIS